MVFLLSRTLGLLWLLLGFSTRADRLPDWLPELRDNLRESCEAAICIETSFTRASCSGLLFGVILRGCRWCKSMRNMSRGRPKCKEGLENGRIASAVPKPDHQEQLPCLGGHSVSAGAKLERYHAVWHGSMQAGMRLRRRL